MGMVAGEPPVDAPTGEVRAAGGTMGVEDGNSESADEYEVMCTQPHPRDA